MSVRGDHRTEHHRGGWALWFGFLGAPVAWAVHLTVAYLLEDLSCAAAESGYPAPTGTVLRLLLVAITVVLAAVVVWSGLLAFRGWRRSEGGEDLASFLRLTGMLLAVVSLFAVILQGIPPLVLPACL